MVITKVCRLSDKNARVVLDDGRKIKVPVDLARVGVYVSPADVREICIGKCVDYIYVTLYKPKRVPRIPTPVRDMSSFDSEEELSIIRSRVVRNSDVFGRRLSRDEVSELAEDIFLHFWERGYFQGYDNHRLQYISYISRGVRNFMIDRAKSTRYHLDRRTVSLNSPVLTADSGDGDTELQDFISDPTVDIQADLEKSALYDKFKAQVVELDEVGTGLKDVSYQDIFKYLVESRPLKDLAESSGYSIATLNSRKETMCNKLRSFYKDYTAEISDIA